jgi:arylsulfatase A-like enzyme/tetratricopeptide (TPR) repeat protein
VVSACAGLLVAAATLWFLTSRPGADPGELVRRLWSRSGVARPNVVLVTLDTTRADRLGCYGDADAKTPALDRLASEGVLFTQAAAPVPLTLPSHSSIMTGHYPTYHGVRLNGTTALGRQQTTLAERLTDAGYRTGAFVGAFVLDGRWGLNQGFNHYDDRFDLMKVKHIDLAGVQRPANEVVDAAVRWLGEHRSEPFFAWLHLYDPHTPYAPPEPLFSEFGRRGPEGLYAGEIAFVDQQIDRLLAWLRDTSLDDRTIVVVVGDHGEALGSHGEGTHGYFIYDWATRVPFIVKTPFDDLRGVRVDAQVSLVDVFPTVLALAGIEAGSATHGRSLVPAMFRRDREEAVYAYAESMAPDLQFGWSPLRSIRSPQFKYIEAPRPELYDLVADPGEATNIYAQRGTVAEAMARALDRIVAETSSGAPAPEAANLDKETLARLASLGYIGTATARTAHPTDVRNLPDPKDKLQVFMAVQRAGELMSDEQYAEAVPALESALRQEPAMPQAQLMLGACYSEAGRVNDAKAQFDQVLKQDPESIPALIGLANLLMAEGRFDDVVTLSRRTVSMDPANTQAYTLLGEVYLEQRQPAKALPHLEKAVEIQPKITQNRLNLAACLIDVREHGRAERLLREIVDEHPRFPGARFNQGVLFEEQGRIEEARQAYLAEVANYPNRFKARFNLGKILAALGDWNGSMAQMREIIRIAPERPEGYLFLARGLLQQRASVDEVQGLAEKGLSLATTSELKALGWFLLADVFERQGQPDRVSAALRHARAHASQPK